MLFVFAYVDLFSLYRPDVRADLEAGQIGGFTVNQTFLLCTTAYVVIPALMVFGTLVLRPAINRIANIALSILYAVTIIGAAIGEGNYYTARQRPRGRTARGRRLLRLDLAQARRRRPRPTDPRPALSASSTRPRSPAPMSWPSARSPQEADRGARLQGRERSLAWTRRLSAGRCRREPPRSRTRRGY